jgi:isopenicillin N synthase-like dioxygenase
MRTDCSETMEEYFGAVRELGVRVFRLILSSLGVECSEAQSGRFSPKEPALIRLNHYPPCPDPSLTTGLIPHHDANLITVLHQGDVGGLQVMREGRWYAVRPHPEAFAINAGNMLQVSILHSNSSL